MNVKEADRIYKSELAWGERFNDERELFIADCIGLVIECAHLDAAPKLKARCLAIIQKRYVVFSEEDFNSRASAFEKKIVREELEKQKSFGVAAF